MIQVGIFGVLCGSAVMITFFLSIYFVFNRGKESLRFVWLGLIFLATGLRLGKSIVYFILNDMAPIGLAAGFLGLASVGPMVWLHTRDKLNFKSRDLIPHLFLPIAGSIFCFAVSPSPWETWAYMTGTLILGGYLGRSWAYILKHKDEQLSIYQWKRKVLILASGVWLALVYQHLTGTMMEYAYGSLIASLFVYWIFFQSLNTQLNLNVQKRLVPDHILAKIKDAFEKEGIYKQHSINLNEFSNIVEIPPYLASKGVKKLYGRSFPDTLNYFRVEAIKRLLEDGNYQHLKIESLAYDAGFSSPSSFYAAFKKVTGSSPTEFVKSRELKSA